MIRPFPRLAVRVFALLALLALLVPLDSEGAPFYLSWSQLYDDAATVSQFPHAVAMDSRGNVFVTGHAIVGSAKGFYTAKYDTLDGHLIWSKQLNGAGTNQFIANAIAVDSQGDCVVTGSRNVAGDIDYYTVKYSGVDGTLVWQKPFDGANNGEDDALRVVCDSAGNAIVTGRSTGKNASNSTGFDWVTIKYKAADGTQLGIDSYTQTSGNVDDVPAALAVDSSNNIYVAGTVQTGLNVNRLYVRKLKAADLTKLWDIVPINTGTGAADAEGGATALAVDTDNTVVVTGGARDGTNHFGFFTVKFSALGVELWRTAGPFSADTFGIPYVGSMVGSNRAKAIGVAIGPDHNPIVTGTLLDASGRAVARTIKFTSGGFFGGGSSFWEADAIDAGFGFGGTIARDISTDGASSAVVVGETGNQDGNTDVYIAKYDALTGTKVYSTGFAGSFSSSPDTGVGVAADKFGNIAALGDLVADKGTGIGLHEFGTIKLNRLIAPTGDDLRDSISGVGDTAKVTVAGAPAISDSGVLATKVAFKAGAKVGNALLVEGSAAGGTLLPAVRGQPAPVAMGDSAVNWVSFSDPVVAPDGSYAFAAKVSGAASAANGVWTKFSGKSLQLALRQGSVVPGLSDKLVSVANMAMENGTLVALVKLAAPAATNMALVRINNAGGGTVLLRTGQSGLLLNATDDYTVRSINVLSPAPLEAGDGRWQGDLGIVARVTATKTDDVKVKATAIVSISNAGTRTTLFNTGQTAVAPIASATYAGFGLPSAARGTQSIAVKAMLTPRPAASNSALIYTATGTTFHVFAQKGLATDVIGLPAEATYGDFTDPIMNTNGLVAYIATLKGSAVEPTSNKAIVFGNPNTPLLLQRIARTGDSATDTAGNATLPKWSAFTALALPGGTGAGPIFVAKLATGKNPLGLWACDSSGAVRLLLRQGDDLGGQIVKKMTLLKAVSKGMSAPRSFDAAGSVAVALTFTDGKSALMRIGIP